MFLEIMREMRAPSEFPRAVLAGNGMMMLVYTLTSSTGCSRPPPRLERRPLRTRVVPLISGAVLSASDVKSQVSRCFRGRRRARRRGGGLPAGRAAGRRGQDAGGAAADVPCGCRLPHHRWEGGGLGHGGLRVAARGWGWGRRVSAPMYLLTQGRRAPSPSVAPLPLGTGARRRTPPAVPLPGQPLHRAYHGFFFPATVDQTTGLAATHWLIVTLLQLAFGFLVANSIP
eukprot:7237723-Prymnesium_polylepis.1